MPLGEPSREFSVVLILLVGFGNFRFPPTARVTHTSEVECSDSDNMLRVAFAPNDNFGHFPSLESHDNEDLILVDNNGGMPVSEEGHIVLPGLDSLVLDEEVTSEDVAGQECAGAAALDPNAPAFVDPSFMDTNEVSHFYANDQTLQSLHSQSLAEAGQSIPDPPRVYAKRNPVPIPSTSGYSKRKVLQALSPPIPGAKRTLGSPSKSVRESFVDICMRPTRLLRSRGTAPDVPNIPFPAESRAYSRALERLEADNAAADPERVQDVPVPEDVPRS